MILKKVSPTKAWGYGGPHGLFKRGREFDSEDPNDVARLLANIKVLIKQVCESFYACLRPGVTRALTAYSSAAKTWLKIIRMRKLCNSWKRWVNS